MTPTPPPPPPHGLLWLLVLAWGFCGTADGAGTGTVTPADLVECEDYEEATWYESECQAYLEDPVQVFCLGKLHDESNGSATTEHSEETHASVPHNLIVLFGTFMLGAFVRFWTVGTPLPFTVVMFVLGFGYGACARFTSGVFDNYTGLADMNPHLILYAFLPVLIFESAFAMEIPVFKKVIVQCIILAGPGLMIASGLTGMVARYVFTEYNWNLEACLLFGTILSATDPVAVVALLKELGASKLISTMIEGESLFNDGTAIVFFNVLIGAVERDSCTPDWASCGEGCECTEFKCELQDSLLDILINFCKVSFGGPLVGLVVAFFLVKCLDRVFNDTLIEVTLTLCSSYITFFVCEGFLEVSGVLGLVTLGCYLSYFRNCISPEVEHTLHHFWEMAVFLTNSCIFALAGLMVVMKAFDDVHPIDAFYLLVTYVTINLVRTFVLLLFTPVLNLFEFKLGVGNSALVAWGGLRGAVGLSLALVLQQDEQVVQPHVRDKVIFHTAGIVLLTLLVNGTTTQKLVSFFKLNAVELRRKRMMDDRFKQLSEESKQEVIDLRKNPLNYDCNWKKVEDLTVLNRALPDGMRDPYNRTDENLTPGTSEADQAELFEAGRVAYLHTAESSVHVQYGAGAISASSSRRLDEIIHKAYERTPGKREKDNPKGYMMASDLSHVMFEPKLHRYLGRFANSNWLKNAFETIVGYVEVHKHAQKKIPQLADRFVANAIVAHCKKTSNDAIRDLGSTVRESPHLAAFARSVRTKHAARHVLNYMRSRLNDMQRAGRLDEKDKIALTCMIEKQMLVLKTQFPTQMEQAAAVESLHLASWYANCEPEAQRELQTLVAMPGSVRVWPADVEASFLKRTSAELGRPAAKNWRCPGLFLVITGIVQVRLGRKMYHQGAGFTIGLQSVLTGPLQGSERFSDVFAETDVTTLFIDWLHVNSLVERYPGLASELWRACGVDAARMLLQMELTYQHWDESKVRNVTKNGYVDFILDPSRGDDVKKHRRLKMPENCITVLLRGNVWEFTPGDTIRFPQLLPPGYKYGTFSGHAVVFHIEEDIWASRAEISLQRWGRLKSKVNSIALWSGLRSPEWRRKALALALRRTPPKELPVERRASAAPVAEGGGAKSDWNETFDPQHQRLYYWNRATGVRQWNEPEEHKAHKLANPPPPSNLALSQSGSRSQNPSRRPSHQQQQQQLLVQQQHHYPHQHHPLASPYGTPYSPAAYPWSPVAYPFPASGFGNANASPPGSPTFPQGMHPYPGGSPAAFPGFGPPPPAQYAALPAAQQAAGGGGGDVAGESVTRSQVKDLVREELQNAIRDLPAPGAGAGRGRDVPRPRADGGGMPVTQTASDGLSDSPLPADVSPKPSRRGSPPQLSLGGGSRGRGRPSLEPLRPAKEQSPPPRAPQGKREARNGVPSARRVSSSDTALSASNNNNPSGSPLRTPTLTAVPDGSINVQTPILAHGTPASQRPIRSPASPGGRLQSVTRQPSDDPYDAISRELENLRQQPLRLDPRFRRVAANGNTDKSPEVEHID